MNLNDQQRAAVEHGDGPLMIVAGAGTGKTRVIVERVGHLLRSVPGIKPENILALTFARKAAAEMHRRAIEQFGDAARRCRFATFHAFCFDLLRKELPMRALDGIDQWIFFRRHLEDLEPEYYLKISEPGRFLHDLVDFCSRCHDNLVSPEEFRRYVERRTEEHERELRTGRKPGKEEQEENARLRELARVYERSESLQAREGLLSFGAMISQAVARLRASEPLLQRVRNRYAYILVDEFQDTNAAQWELLKLLAGERRNVAVVGDDYQAIYRFRGASNASLDQFQQKDFPECKPIVLNRNYRSTKAILQIADSVARRLSSYQAKKQLVPDDREPGRRVEVAEFSSAEQQAEWVAAELESRMAQPEEEAPESSAPRFAVLYRAHLYRGLLVAALQRRGIPFVIRNLAVNNLPQVRNLVAYLRAIGGAIGRAIGRPNDAVSLARVLCDPQWGLDLEQLVRYCHAAGGERAALLAVIERDEAGWPGRKRLLALLARYRNLSALERVTVWLEALRRELGWGGDPASQPALRTFSDFVAKWDRGSSTGMLEEFLEYYSYFEEAGGVVALPEDEEERAAGSDVLLLRAQEGVQEGAVAEQLPLTLGPAKTAVSQKVQLMSVHAAKGLEFEHVFLLHLVRGAFPVRNRRPLISLPDELWKGPLLEGDFHIEEERRLFYVALTRARSTLTLCTVSTERRKPSPFLMELAEPLNPNLRWTRPSVPASPSESPGGVEGVAGESHSPSHSKSHTKIGEWAAAALPTPDGFSLSASAIETYVQCPLKYRFSYEWRIPWPPSPAIQFGSVMHGAVREVMGLLVQDGQDLTRDALQSILDRRWVAAGFADPVQERKYREEGLRQLEGVCRAWPQDASQDRPENRMELLHQEKSFEFERGRTKLVGRIDQIHRLPSGEVELVEYKTGRPQTQKEADGSAQLTLYADACRRVLGLPAPNLVLFNLATGERIRTARSEEQLQAFEQTIRQTAGAIRAGRFPARPGYLCRYCDFRPICPAHDQEGPGSTV